MGAGEVCLEGAEVRVIREIVEVTGEGPDFDALGEEHICEGEAEAGGGTCNEGFGEFSGEFFHWEKGT